VVDSSLDRLRRTAGLGSDAGGKVADRCAEVLLSDDLVDQSGVERRGGIEVRAQQHEKLGARGTHELRQPLRSPSGGEHAKA
jgi:hypothetical protein